MCEILEGKNSVCDSVGGIKKVVGWNTANATTTEANGTISALSLTSGKYGHVFYIEMETAKFNANRIGDRKNQSIAYEQSGTMYLAGNTATDIANLEALEIARTTFAVQLNDDTWEVFFLKNGAMVSGVRDSGQAYEDANGNTLTLSGKEKNRPYKISNSLITAILDPVS
jgi:hypothetical protein